METLTNEELCVLAKDGDGAARERLIANNLPFVRRMANARMVIPANTERFRTCGITADDLVQAGSIGLLNAIDGFELASGNAFMTYAGQAVNNAMNDLVVQYSRDFAWRLSVDSGKAVKVLSWEEPNPTTDEDDTPTDVGEAFRLDSCFLPPEEAVIREDARQEVRDAIELLSERERVYIRYRFGFESGEQHTLTETAAQFRLTESRAKGVETGAFKSIKQSLFVVFPEQAFVRAEDGLTKRLVADGELHAVELRLKSQKRRGRKITAAVYDYLADYDGYCGVLQFNFVDSSAEVVTLAEWDTTVTHRFAMRAMEHFREYGADALPERLTLTFVVPEDYIF